MARLIDPPACLSKTDSGVPPDPPEAHQKAIFQRRTFVVAVELRESLETGDVHGDQASMQMFFETFVAHGLEGVGYWTWGQAIGLARCEVCHLERPCIEAIWNYLEDGDE